MPIPDVLDIIDMAMYTWYYWFPAFASEKDRNDGVIFSVAAHPTSRRGHPRRASGGRNLLVDASARSNLAAPQSGSWEMHAPDPQVRRFLYT